MKSTGKTTQAVLVGVVLLLVCTLVDHVAALTASYDAFVDFSFASNPTPDGLWRYGFTPPGAAGPLTLYTHRDSPFGLSAWRDATDPNVIKNETGSDLLVFGAILFPATEFLHFHPGPNGERSVVRWTAPAAGAYQIAADFRGLRIDSCGQTVDVHVLHNGTELYRADISSGRDVRSFLGTRTIDIGDTVDFQVGRGPDSYFCDSTGLKATITPLAKANAGPDQTVNEGALVTLDGTLSTGPNLSFSWEQLAGASVTLHNATSSQPSFTAPELPGGFGSQVLTFKLTVSSGSQASSDTGDVTVKNVNHAPEAHAGAAQTVNEGSLVTLHGSASFDPDGDAMTFQWTQTGGIPVELTGVNTATPTFIAPLLPGGVSGFATLTFSLTVSEGECDGCLSDTDTVAVVVEQVNHAPVADAGTDQTKNEETLVTLDGTSSNDPDSDSLTYTWSQISGPPVTLSDSRSATPSFMAPRVGPGGATLVFRLVVNDGLADSPFDDVVITVLNVNDPPICEHAQANPARLWPPNHKLISVGIVGVSDPNNDSVVITLTGVTQDEPVNGLSDGDTSPDAVMQGSTVLLRAERSGKGNGRVYQVTFTANDGQGGMCTGSVNVSVPDSLRPGLSAVDDGQLYDATQP